uniref:Uncharacterized protein n=1 Tax=Knipowitschia caucasica TaxID=637954 RepID=A0AAV2LEW8_KNICA
MKGVWDFLDLDVGVDGASSEWISALVIAAARSLCQTHIWLHFGFHRLTSVYPAMCAQQQKGKDTKKKSQEKSAFIQLG